MSFRFGSFQCAALLLAALALPACGAPSGPSDSDDGSSEAARAFQGVVRDYPGPSARLVVTVPDAVTSPADEDSLRPQQEARVLGEGSIDTDGSFAFEFAAVPPASALLPVGLLEGLSGCAGDDPTVNDSSIGVYVEGLYGGIVVVDGATPIGTIAKLDPITYSSDDPVIDDGAATSRFYASAPLRIEGTCRTADGLSTTTFDLDLEGGWSIVSSEYSFDPQTGASESRVYGGDSPAEWRYSDSFGGF